MPDVSMVHVDQALTNVSIQYRNSDYVADLLFPPLPVPKQSNKYFVYSKDRFRVVEDARRPGAKANEIVWSLSTDTYYAEGHALAEAIPDELKANADGALDMGADATEELTDKIYLQREILAAKKATDNTVITQHKAAAGWDAAGTPIADVEAGKTAIRLATGKTANTLLLSYPVFLKVRSNSDLINRIKYTQNVSLSNLDANALAAAFDVEKVIIGGAIKNTANEGAADAMDWVWGKNALLLYSPPGALGLKSLSLGAQFRWTFGANTGGYLVKRYRDESRTAEVVEVQMYHDVKVVAASAGYLFDGCIS